MPLNVNSKILITGGRSLIASTFKTMYPDDVVCPGRDQLDITDLSQVRSWLESNQFHTVINTVGISSKSAFEMYGTNARYPFHMAEICTNLDIRFVMLSSSRVFDGNKDIPYLEADTPNPMDDYGQSKELGEIMVRNLHWKVPYYIFRLPLILGARERNRDAQIVSRLIDQAIKEKKVRVAFDVLHSPIHVNHIVKTMMDCICTEKPEGIYHLGRGGAISLYDLMVSVFEGLDIRADVKPVKAKDLDPHNPFPRCQSLSSHNIEVASSLYEDINLFVSDESRNLERMTG